MAHYAKIENSLVIKVIVADENFFNTFQDDSPGKWLKCSYNSHGGKHFDETTMLEDSQDAFRMNFPSPGYTYDSIRDAFIAPQPFNSWTLNEDTCLWEAPTMRPSDGLDYSWNEDTLSWVLINE